MLAVCPQPLAQCVSAPLLRPSRSCGLLRGAQLRHRGTARRARPVAAQQGVEQRERREEDEGCTTSGRKGGDSASGRTERTPGSATALAACAAAAAAAAALLGAEPALGAALHTEPGNALSLPTWAVHTSSVIEWVMAIGLMYQYADATGNPAWRGMAWGMLPSLGGAMCACTWHFFYNSPDLEFLVSLQALLTVIGNTTCWIAAYRIYKSGQEQGA